METAIFFAVMFFVGYAYERWIKPNFRDPWWDR